MWALSDGVALAKGWFDMGTYYLVHESLGRRGHRPGLPPDAEKARRGGLTIRDKYGREYYRDLGRKGGLSVRQKHGSEHFARIGRRGGEQTKARYGAEYYTRIGKRGGEARAHSRTQGKQ